MRNLKDYDEFMEFTADAFEPICMICADPDVAAVFRSGGRIASAVSVICRKHKDEAAAILGALEGMTADEYRAAFSPFAIPGKIRELLSSGMVSELFASAQQTAGASSSGTAPDDTAD